eukprot:COSAG04_NODE_770_length_10444_cov_6.484872_3_plen_160_part_00
MFWQYKFHWDAELTHHNLDNDMARYVTALLYLTDVEAGGETLLPLADEGMEGLGCAGCEQRPDLRASSRSQGCFECIAPRQDALLENCAEPGHGGLSVAPKAGRLVLWYNYDADGEWQPAALHAGCSVRAGEKLVANFWLDRRGGELMVSEVRRGAGQR